MNQVIHSFNSPSLTMSSREIAELTGKRHDHVMIDIRKMLDELDLSAPDFSGTYRTTQGNEYACFNLPRRECDILIAGYSVKYRAAIVDRWTELEAQAAPQIPTTLSGALRLAADQAEQIERQQKAIEAAQPAIRFLDKFVESKSTKSLREVAKVLGVKERQFISRLEDDGILFRQSGNLLPIAHYHHKGYFEVKTGEANGHAYQQTRFTPDGITWIAKRFGLTTQEVA